VAFTSCLAGFSRRLRRSASTTKIIDRRILHISFEAARNSSGAVAVAVPPLSIVSSEAPVLVVIDRGAVDVGDALVLKRERARCASSCATACGA